MVTLVITCNNCKNTRIPLFFPILVAKLRVLSKSSGASTPSGGSDALCQGHVDRQCFGGFAGTSRMMGIGGASYVMGVAQKKTRVVIYIYIYLYNMYIYNMYIYMYMYIYRCIMLSHGHP